MTYQSNTSRPFTNCEKEKTIINSVHPLVPLLTKLERVKVEDNLYSKLRKRFRIYLTNTKLLSPKKESNWGSTRMLSTFNSKCSNNGFRTFYKLKTSTSFH